MDTDARRTAGARRHRDAMHRGYDHDGLRGLALCIVATRARHVLACVCASACWYGRQCPGSSQLCAGHGDGYAPVPDPVLGAHRTQSMPCRGACTVPHGRVAAFPSSRAPRGVPPAPDTHACVCPAHRTCDRPPPLGLPRLAHIGAAHPVLGLCAHCAGRMRRVPLV